MPPANRDENSQRLISKVKVNISMNLRVVSRFPEKQEISQNMRITPPQSRDSNAHL